MNKIKINNVDNYVLTAVLRAVRNGCGTTINGKRMPCPVEYTSGGSRASVSYVNNAFNATEIACERVMLTFEGKRADGMRVFAKRWMDPGEFNSLGIHVGDKVECFGTIDGETDVQTGRTGQYVVANFSTGCPWFVKNRGIPEEALAGIPEDFVDEYRKMLEVPYPKAVSVDGDNYVDNDDVANA